jgi:hypothetical protein
MPLMMTRNRPAKIVEPNSKSMCFIEGNISRERTFPLEHRPVDAVDERYDETRSYAATKHKFHWYGFPLFHLELIPAGQ